MDWGVLRRSVSRGSRTSDGLEPYSSHERNPASLGEGEAQQLLLGRGVPLSLLSPQEDRLAGLEVAGPGGDELDSGMDMDLLC